MIVNEAEVFRKATFDIMSCCHKIQPLFGTTYLSLDINKMIVTTKSPDCYHQISPGLPRRQYDPVVCVGGTPCCSVHVPSL